MDNGTEEWDIKEINITETNKKNHTSDDRLITEEDIININYIIKDVISKNITKKSIDKHMFNFKKAGKVATQQILSIFNSI